MDKKQDPPIAVKSSFEEISIDVIDDPRAPIRTDLSPESLEELVGSIRQFGIIEPLAVKRVGDRFEVIAGHRRLTAAGIAGLVAVPCYIFNVPEEEAEFIKIHENLYREDIKPSDQAEHFDYLIRHFKLSPAKISKLVRKSESFVTERLQILSYPAELREALDSGKIKYSIAREFYRIKDITKLREYLRYATANGISPNMAKSWVEDALKPAPSFVQTNDDTGSPASPAPYEAPKTSCIYCTEIGELAHMEIVYMHSACLQKVASN